MKKLFTPEILVGFFALVGLFIVIYFSLEVSESNIGRGSTKEYFAIFNSVTGVVNKSPVEMSGIRVGYIDDIKLVNNKARVTVKIIADLTLYENASLAVKDRGILGDRFLQLAIGTSDHPVLKEGGEIKNSISKSDMEQLISSLNNAAHDIQKVTKSLGAEADKGSLNDIIDNIKTLSKNLSEMVQSNRESIDKIISNLAEVTKSLKIALGTGEDAKKTGETLRSAITKLESAIDSVNNIAKKIDKGEGTIGKLVNDKSTAEKLDSAIDGVNEYLDSARKIQTRLRYRGEYLLDSKKMQNSVAIRIQPKPDKYLELEFIDAPKGNTSITDTTVVLPDGTVAAETKTISTRDDLFFSLQVAKRFYDLNIRFGIIRNDGGFGFDYYFLNDIIKFSFEAFNFQRYDNRPRLRSYATVKLFKYILLTGGINDMIVRQGNRDFFLGAGFSITDNDLKTVLTSFKIPGL